MPASCLQWASRHSFGDQLALSVIALGKITATLTPSDRWHENRIHRLRYCPPFLYNRNSSRAEHACVRGPACHFGTPRNVLPRSRPDVSRQMFFSCKLRTDVQLRTSNIDRLNEEQRQAFSSQVQFWDLLSVTLHGHCCLLVLTVRSRTMRCGHCRHVSELARYLMAASWNDRLGSYHVVAFYSLPESRRPEGQR